MSNQKYEITDIAHEKYPFLHRIRALRDIGSEVLLSQLKIGKCRVEEKAGDERRMMLQFSHE